MVMIREALRKTPQSVRLILAMIAVQTLFWLVIKPLIIGTPNPGFDTIAGYDYSEAQLAAPTYDAVQQAQFEPIAEMPDWHCCQAGYRAFRYNFSLEHVPETGLGISPHVRADNYAIHVNGTYVAGAGRLERPDHTYNALLRKTHLIPESVLQPGENEVTFILVRDGIPYFDYFAPVLGEYQQIQSDMARTEFMSDGYTYLVFAAVALVALFSFIFFVISGRQPQAFWMFVLASSLAALNHYYVWIDPPFDGNVRVAYFFVLSILVQFAWFAWANAWSRDTYRWVLPLALIIFGICATAAVLCFALLPAGSGYDRASEIMSYSGIGFAIATVVRLVWNFRDLAEDRYLEAAIALLLVSLFALQAITELTSALNMGYVSRTQPFLIIGIGIAFFARGVRLFRSSAQINEVLKEQLDQRTAQLAASHEREKRFVRQQALDEERQRIMRDMHDGLGSHLMSMMMMAKRGAGKHADFADGIQSVIDEMRLLIDSMDSVGESLRSALTVFRKRIIPRAQDAGFSVIWNEKPDVAYPAYSPREVLQVFRILQEAITNALKHSQGDTITVDITPGARDECGCIITIRDNGKGLDSDASKAKVGGRGLKNMRARAAGIGAELAIRSETPGTSVILQLAERP